ncbi:MAG: hypothetical protein ABEH78_04200 [Haloferacaceae archaeon]
MPDWDDIDAAGLEDPDDTRDVAARRWRPTHVVERALGIDEYRSVVARLIGIETGPVSDLMIDVVALVTVLFVALVFLLVRSLVV